MNTQIGLIDVDGVLANFNNAFLDKLNAKHKWGNWRRFQSPEGPTTWDWPQAIGFPQEEIDAAWASVAKDPSFWTQLSPYPGTVDFLQRLLFKTQSRRIQPYFVTNRIPPIAAALTNKWLTWHGYPSANVIAVRSKTKHLIAEAVGADFILDDYWGNFDGLKPHVRRYMLDRPWNRDVIIPNVYRVMTPFEALEAEVALTAPALEVAA